MHRLLSCCRLLWAFCMLQPLLAALFFWCNLQMSWLRYLFIASNCKALCGQVTGFGPYMLGNARLMQLFWHNLSKAFMTYLHSMLLAGQQHPHFPRCRLVCVEHICWWHMLGHDQCHCFHTCLAPSASIFTEESVVSAFDILVARSKPKNQATPLVDCCKPCIFINKTLAGLQRCS